MLAAEQKGCPGGRGAAHRKTVLVRGTFCKFGVSVQAGESREIWKLGDVKSKEEGRGICKLCACRRRSRRRLVVLFKSDHGCPLYGHIVDMLFVIPRLSGYMPMEKKKEKAVERYHFRSSHFKISSG